MVSICAPWPASTRRPTPRADRSCTVLTRWARFRPSRSSVPDDEHVALPQGSQAAVDARPVVADARGDVVVEVDRVVDASGPQGVALQNQLDLDADELADYAVRSETRHEHLAELSRLYGFRSFSGGAARELVERLRDEAEQAQSNEDLVRRFVEACRDRDTPVSLAMAVFETPSFQEAPDLVLLAVEP